jgi:hypothetical protein
MSTRGGNRKSLLYRCAASGRGAHVDKLIFSCFRVEVFSRDGKLHVRWDAGGIATRMREAEISPEEADRLCKSERDAYEVLLDVDRRNND